jgi:hypothetical protein
MKVYRLKAKKMDSYQGRFGECGSYNSIFPETMIEEQKRKLRDVRGNYMYIDIEAIELSKEEMENELRHTESKISGIENTIKNQQIQLEQEQRVAYWLNRGISNNG